MKKVIIKDTLMKLLTLVIAFGLLVYVGWLLMQGQQVSADIKTNMIVLIVCGLLAIFLLVLMFRPRLVTTNRWVLGGLGIVTILAAQYMLIDNPGGMVYLRDIMTLVGVYLTITGPTNLLVSEKVKEALADENVEIIEV